MSGPERKCFRIHINETIELPERSEAWVSETVDCKNRQPALWLVESRENENQIQVEDVLAEQAEDGVVYLRVMNNSYFPRKLKKGMKVAQCESVQAEAAVNIQMLASDKAPRAKRMPDHLRSLFNDATKFMVPEEAQSVRQLLIKYQHVLSAGPDDLGKTELVKHKIDTGDNSPIKMAPRRIPLAKQADATRCLQEMKEQGIIKASNSPWSAPVVLVKKKDNTTRFCVEYRALNEVTKRDSFPLLRIDTVLDSLAGSSWFSTLDMKSGYWQVAMDPKDQEKTAFSAADSLWEFSVMPFGLCNSPATFSRLMDQVLHGVPPTSCLKYLDDLIVHGRSFVRYWHTWSKSCRSWKRQD